jgi:hypothetical protein
MSESNASRTFWVSYGGGPHGKDHLAPDVRAAVERREQALAEQRGPLLCEVQVRVYARDVAPDEMWVSFPPGSALGEDSDPAEIAAAVERARQTLAHWR